MRRPTRPLLAVLATLAPVGCAHQPLTTGELKEVAVPAFISRIEQEAGPRSRVFQEDGSYATRLKRLSPREADRRLAARLDRAMKRFEIAERLRVSTMALLPQGPPWTRAVDPVAVSTALQQFLVQEVPANPPDYELMKDLGADTVVELVVEEYGLRSEGGKAQGYLLGYGRMFEVGGPELWRRAFRVDLLEEPAFEKLDPFEVAKEEAQGFPSYREAMGVMLDAAARQFAEDLTPPPGG